MFSNSKKLRQDLCKSLEGGTVPIGGYGPFISNRTLIWLMRSFDPEIMFFQLTHESSLLPEMYWMFLNNALNKYRYLCRDVQLNSPFHVEVFLQLGPRLPIILLPNFNVFLLSWHKCRKVAYLQLDLYPWWKPWKFSAIYFRGFWRLHLRPRSVWENVFW